MVREGKTRRNGSRGRLPDAFARGDLPPGGSEPVLYTRDDWTEFRDVNRLPAKAGVKRGWLPRVAIKELVDNALDAGTAVSCGIPEGGGPEFRFFIEDDGPGLPGTSDELAAFFSVRRPLTSSKTRRMPTRGMLGNGLRVVVGVVLVGGGTVTVYTRGRRLTLRPRADGSTAIESEEPWEGTGTRIEITLAGEMADLAWADGGLFGWRDEAVALWNEGTQYRGESSPWWYGDAAFWELCQAAGRTRVEQVCKGLDGCTAKARLRAVVGDLWGRPAETLTRAETDALLARAKASTKPVTPDRLGRVGERDDFAGYARETGTYERDGATVPYVVEAWANRATTAGVTVCVNRTPVVTDVGCWRTGGMEYTLGGAGLAHGFPIGKKSCGELHLALNVTSPFVPLTSSGKDPDLGPMVAAIVRACQKAAKKCRATAPKGVQKVSQKAVILKALPDAAARLGAGGNIFSLRQLYYAIRPVLIEAIGREPDYGTFSRVVGDHEDEHGEVDGLYRDDRGTLYHPHTGENIPLGTRSVATYQRPAWGFNKILYCEKEGFFPILQKARWPERHDCALLTSKGFASRAARDVMRMMGESGEEITFYCIHDADGAGTVIYDSLREALEPAGVRVVNLGLDPAEGRAMGLSEEPVQGRKTKGDKVGRIPVGAYLPTGDAKWLQSNRIELNAMTTPQFLDWLTRKLGEHSTAKVRPPAAVVADRFTQATREGLTRRLTERVLAEAGVEARVTTILESRRWELEEAWLDVDDALDPALEGCPPTHWSGVVDEHAAELSDDWAE